MGNRPGGGSFTDISGRLEARVGKIQLSGRYHRHPRTIDHDYSVVDKALGSGYNGVVRMAVSKTGKGQQKYAVKAFKLASIPKDKKAQLESEVEIFLCMDHPHITHLYDVYESEEMLHLVMECCEGGELFERITEVKRFSEKDAADAVWQMLLAVNYIHSHGIVHRDLKLENFLYDSKGGSHLKLIDFGFSKMWDPNIKMHVSCGTLAYVAPEVLQKSYTSQCDMWSLGVIVFILLSGYMPFSGSEAVQTKNISEGNFKMKPERWHTVSKGARDFVMSLLQVDPHKRMTAGQALEHRWIQERREKEDDVDIQVVDALRKFGQASKFRRCCMEMMAWSLSNTERAKVRQYFVAMDANHHGTITLQELKKVLEDKFHVPENETRQIFDALDSNHDEEIHYSDFLAAMISTRIALHDDILQQTFKRFDTDESGYITVDNLREVLGNTFEGEQVEKFVAEADRANDGRISYPEFVAYLRGDPLDDHGAAAAEIIDGELKKGAKPFGASEHLNEWRLVPKRSSSVEDPAALNGGGAGGPAPEKFRKTALQATGQPKCCVVS
mmetsp:Transcript_35365/g.75384  ORF Transcript_35365/g.75384 Transcript_35365/m.75384 type:complete len:556 (+) Transcript_35365:125-1792(+)|eukprot:CAMPEP_0206455254 /NCGR_PEP_ID=MMETSP0324_2-20121206/21644_1 /ASSEMBLY_ACC=CAM_ASM_000836 /TAXON_ID=2866 /ORGANISM="Crypthecodinium cohnii, Strain Seligo" /LENGTH=555 /DNA_ID=CAMNT_0053925925 /DNA_START=122 /DNA_END=1789 /DNA_ORIENTATION=+